MNRKAAPGGQPTAEVRATAAEPARKDAGPGQFGQTSQTGKTGQTFEIHTPVSPRELLLSYQRRWSDDKSRFKIGLQARQTGKDFSSGDEGISDCYEHELEGRKTGWMIAAPSERQSLESLEKWKEWTEAYHLSIADILEERESGPAGAKPSEALLKSATIVFPNGSRVIAVPGKPDTVRGFSMNLLMTEFAFFEDPDRTWRAALPSITNPLRGGAKKVRLISTPNGQGNKFHELWKKNYGKKAEDVAKEAESIVPAHVREKIEDALKVAQENAGGERPKLTAREAQMVWSCHLVTIYDAVKAGLPVNLYELYAGMDDPEGWAQEFECQFLDAAAVLLPYELIALCEAAEASESVPMEYWLSAGQFPVDLGIDFGRKKDLTVCWAAEKVADLQITKEVLCLERMSTPDQVDALRPRIQRARRVCLDYTGPGIGMGDYLVKEFGEWKPEEHKFGKVELVTMTNQNKVEMFGKLRMAFERRNWRIPISRTVREDLHSIYRVVTPSGNISYRAPHSEDGHADRANAQALCTRAGASLGTVGRIIIPSGHRAEVLRGRKERSFSA